MRRLTAFLALVAFMPVAHAQDKGKSDFTHSAEFRVRDTFEQNESGNSAQAPAHHNGIDQRFKLGVGFKANEKFSVNGTFIQSAAWGQSGTEVLADRAGLTTGDQTNFLSVNEAYATWQMTEMFRMRFGRQNFSFGDGSVMSVNDWQRQPYAFDGVTANYELDFGRFQAFAFKYRDFMGPTGYSSGVTASTSDPQHDAFGLVFDLKTMPEWLKTVNAYVIQDKADGVSIPGGSIGSTGNTIQTNQGQNALRYGALVGGAFSIVDVKVGYNMVTGKNVDYGSVAGVGQVVNPSRTINENMLQAEVGVNFPNLMMSRFYVSYHQDSGTSQGDLGHKSNTYDAYLYDRHSGSGMMELVGWGNLTDVAIGWTGKPTDATDVGLTYNMFSKTQSADGINAGYYGTNLFATNGTAVNCTGSNCHSAIGDEIDVWAEHRYDTGLSMMARVGYFMPGSQLKDPVYNRSSSITQVMVQGKFTF